MSTWFPTVPFRVGESSYLKLSLTFRGRLEIFLYTVTSPVSFAVFTACLFQVLTMTFGTGYYFRAADPRNILILLTCTATYSFFITFPQYILQKWTEAPGSRAPFYITSYVVASFLAWTATNGSMA